jgi:hypothetical protein
MTTAKTKTRTVSARDKVRVTKTRLDVYWSDNARFFFVRMNEEDKNDDRLVVLYRLLESYNIDTERAMSSYGRLRAMKLPNWVFRELRHYYEIREMDKTEWLTAV